MPFSGFAHESIFGLAHFIGALMAGLETRIERLEAAASRLRLARYCLRAGIFFAALGERLYGF